MTPASTWQRLLPLRADSDPLLSAIEAELDSERTATELIRHEAEGRYPASVVSRLREVGLAELFSEDATVYQACALNALAARRSGSLAIILGVNTLALLPAHLAATGAQRERIFSRVAGGALSALLLTEWAHGSDLLSTRTRAERDGEAFVVTGEKNLINGGHTADLLMTLVRTGAADSPGGSGLGSTGGFSVLLIERDDTVTALPRYRTLPGAAADISGVKLAGTRVPVTNLIGGQGEGFSIIQKTLTISRGGIGSLAAGAANRAWDLASGYADRRSLYGAPIAMLGGIAEHLHKLEALDLAASALAVKTTAAMNALGQGAAYYTAAAKFACCQLAEQAVDEGRRILSARALLDELPYARLIRDVTLYSVFDGTRHLMLDQVQWRLKQMAAREPGGDPRPRWREIYDTPPVPLGQAVAKRGRPLLVWVHEHARAMGADDLAHVSEALSSLVRWAVERDCWDRDQALQFGAAEVGALLEAALAAAELVTDREKRDPAIGYVGAQAASMLRHLAARVGAGIGELDAAERSLARRCGPPTVPQTEKS